MQDPVLKRIFILAALVLGGWVIYLLMPVIAPFIAAFFLAYLINPLVARMAKYNMPRWLTISIVFLGIIVGVGIGTWYLAPMLWQQLRYALDNIPAAINWVNNNALPWLENNFNLDLERINTDELSAAIMEYVQTNYSANSVQQMVYRIAQSGLNIIHVGGLMVLIPIIAFYFLLDWNSMIRRLQLLIPRHYEPTVVQITRECHAVLGAFVKGQLLVMLLLGIVYAVGLQLIGVEVGLIIGLVAGLCSIIPYLGFAIGIIAAFAASLLQYGLDWVQLLLVLVVFMIGQAIEGYVLQPFLLGDKIGLSPVAVVFAVLAGAQLYGFVGMLVALPVAAVLVVLLRHAYHTYERSVFYMGYRQPASVKVPASSSELSETSITEQDVETHLTLQDDAPELGLHSPVLEHPANYSSSPLNHSSKHGNNGS